MLALETVALGVGVIALIALLRFFDRKAIERFGHKFFTTHSLISIAAAFMLLVLGYAWHTAMLQGVGGSAPDIVVRMRDPLNGIVVMCVGGLIILRTAWVNVRRTNLAWGVGGTAIQIPIYYLLVQFGFVILVITFGLFLASASINRS